MEGGMEGGGWKEYGGYDGLRKEEGKVKIQNTRPSETE